MPRAFLNSIRRTDAFLLVLLLASLSLNVYLGWNLKRLKRYAPEPQNSVKILPGMKVQPITATNLSGQQETISYTDHDKPTVFYVFTPTCVWCERNSNNINTIVSLKGQAFRFIGLSLAGEGLSEYVESHHVNFPVYKSLTSESLRELGLGSTPQTIVIAPDGRVLKNWTGAFGTNVQSQVEEFFGLRLPGLAEK